MSRDSFLIDSGDELVETGDACLAIKVRLDVFVRGMSPLANRRSSAMLLP